MENSAFFASLTLNVPSVGRGTVGVDRVGGTDGLAWMLVLEFLGRDFRRLQDHGVCVLGGRLCLLVVALKLVAAARPDGLIWVAASSPPHR